MLGTAFMSVEKSVKPQWIGPFLKSIMMEWILTRTVDGLIIRDPRFDVRDRRCREANEESVKLLATNGVVWAVGSVRNRTKHRVWQEKKRCSAAINKESDVTNRHINRPKLSRILQKEIDLIK